MQQQLMAVCMHFQEQLTTDIFFTYFKVNDYWMYLCIILDLFSRRIVDYRVSRNASTNLVTSTFRTAFRERGNPSGLTFHSDRGKHANVPSRASGIPHSLSVFVMLYSPILGNPMLPPKV